MTAEHLKPLLADTTCTRLFGEVAGQFARGAMPEEVLQGVKVGRMTALTKPDGGVRGIVVGDVFRRLVARTIAQQFTPMAEGATHPFQYALSTRAGTECVAHVVQALSELDPRSTILSVDGVGAFDNISRAAIFQGVADMPHGEKLIPFIRLFYSTPSRYLWENEVGENVDIFQGEGGEQGDPLMPMLFSLGQHRALVAANAELREGERLMAFLDDVYVSTLPDRTSDAHAALGEHLHTKAGICLHHGKTKIWNAQGEKPKRIDALEKWKRVVRNRKPWCGEVIQICPSPSRG